MSSNISQESLDSFLAKGPKSKTHGRVFRSARGLSLSQRTPSRAAISLAALCSHTCRPGHIALDVSSKDHQTLSAFLNHKCSTLGKKTLNPFLVVSPNSNLRALIFSDYTTLLAQEKSGIFSFFPAIMETVAFHKRELKRERQNEIGIDFLIHPTGQSMMRMHRNETYTSYEFHQSGHWFFDRMVSAIDSFEPFFHNPFPVLKLNGDIKRDTPLTIEQSRQYLCPEAEGCFPVWPDFLPSRSVSQDDFSKVKADITDMMAWIAFHTKGSVGLYWEKQENKIIFLGERDFNFKNFCKNPPPSCQNILQSLERLSLGYDLGLPNNCSLPKPIPPYEGLEWSYQGQWIQKADQSSHEIMRLIQKFGLWRP